MTIKIRDYLPLLKEAIEETKTAGLSMEVDDLEQVCSSACTTSSEMLQEHGLAIKRLLKATRHTLPLSTRNKFMKCLNETELACCGWRKLVAILKRPDNLC